MRGAESERSSSLAQPFEDPLLVHGLEFASSMRSESILGFREPLGIEMRIGLVQAEDQGLDQGCAIIGRKPEGLIENRFR